MIAKLISCYTNKMTYSMTGIVIVILIVKAYKPHQWFGENRWSAVFSQAASLVLRTKLDQVASQSPQLLLGPGLQTHPIE